MRSIHILTGEKGQGKSELLKEIFAQNSARNPEVTLLILDEIGSLELRGEGFAVF
jgi:nucleoside-triphosphatase THEP1